MLSYSDIKWPNDVITKNASENVDKATGTKVTLHEFIEFRRKEGF